MIAPLAYLDTGVPPGAGSRFETVLFVHGDFSAGTFTWGRQIGELKERLRIVSVDRRGHGRTPPAPGRYTIAGDARDLLATARSLGIGRAHLVGHSYGALVALEATRLSPGLVVSLHLVEAPYLSLLPDDPDVGRLARESAAAKGLPAGTPPDAVASAFFEAVIGKAAAERLRSHRAWPGIIRDADRLRREEFAGEYPPLRLGELAPRPTFVYSGGRSHPGLQKVSAELSRRLRAPHETFPEAGHDVPKSAASFTEVLARNVAGAAAEAAVSTSPCLR